MSNRVRLFVFPSRPNFLLAYVPDGTDFTLPVVTAPLLKKSVSDAIAPTEQHYSVTEMAPGRWTSAMTMAKQAETAERRQAHREHEATQASLLQSASDADVRARAKLILKKQVIDAEIRELKTKISAAKSRAAIENIFMPRKEFLKLEERLHASQDESIGIQGELGRLKKLEKEKNVAESKEQSDWFMKAAFELLGEDVFEDVKLRAEELRDASESPGPANQELVKY